MTKYAVFCLATFIVLSFVGRVEAQVLDSDGVYVHHIHFLNADGTVKATTRINLNTPYGPVLSVGVYELGDLDGDGVEDRVVGSYPEAEQSSDLMVMVISLGMILAGFGLMKVTRSAKTTEIVKALPSPRTLEDVMADLHTVRHEQKPEGYVVSTKEANLIHEVIALRPHPTIEDIEQMMGEVYGSESSPSA